MTRLVRFALAIAIGALELGPGVGLAHAVAPRFELALLDGSKFVQLTEFSNRPVLLNFWGSECPPCLRELPLLSAEARRHPSLQFLGVAVDDRVSATRFLTRQPVNYPQLIAPKQPEVLLRRFGNPRGALPYTVLLNARHEICATRIGEVDAEWLSGAYQTCGVATNTAADAARDLR